MEPDRLATELGISAKTLRAWLRRTYPRHLGAKGSSWLLTADQVAAARQRWSEKEAPSVPPTTVAPAVLAGNVAPPAKGDGSNCDVRSMLAKLVVAASPISATTTYSEKPGIYGVFFLGGEFPLPGASITRGTLVYIGKTESSQLTRDLKQHLADGETGHSTLRRTFAALLRSRLGLHPRPRSETEETDRRFKNYKLDDVGERNLTAWMGANLGLAFLPCGGPIAQTGQLESAMIRAAVPVLNLAGNSANPYLKQIKAARAECAALAKQWS